MMLAILRESELGNGEQTSLNILEHGSFSVKTDMRYLPQIHQEILPSAQV